MYHTVDYDDVLAANLHNQANTSTSGSKGTWFSNFLATTRRSSKKSIGGNNSQYFNNVVDKKSEYGDKLMHEYAKELRRNDGAV